MSYEYILVEQRGRVGVVTFNQPDRLNVFSYDMFGEVRQAIETFNEDSSVGAVLLTGSGRAFCAGADIRGWDREIEAREKGGQRRRPREEEENWVHFIQRSKPVICAINGLSIGVGLTMTLPCDVRIASDQARLSMRFVRVGVLPELASTRILIEIVGLTHALELMLSGRIIGAEEAGRVGLVNRVVPHEQLMEAAMDTAAEIAFNPAESLAAIKRLVWQNLTATDLKEVLERENTEFAAAMERPAFKEAVKAFLEKRQPEFHQV
jgi:2-(1,2-epoxy-1,2-dihydrophenyl)acetyl-CoA isomerase